jgi:hypothetical protein
MDSLLFYTIIGEVICISLIVLILKDIKITKTVRKDETSQQNKSYEYLQTKKKTSV